MRAVQKVIRNGNSWVVCLPTVLMQMLNIRPGDFLQWDFGEDGHCTLGKSALHANDAARSPGVLPNEIGAATK